MSGIIAVNFLSDKFDKSLELLNNRGPDFQKSIKIDDKQFGHTRLSIIDLRKEANQPMIFDDILLIFDGAIYNYKELIHVEQLECKTQSDSEVLIRLYQKYGFDFLNKLNGMFSFCIYDIKKDLYFCAKDRYGKKPFFYYFKDNKFIISSSIKSILNMLDNKPNLNKVALCKYIQYFVSFGEDTFFQDINKLEASTYMIYEPNKSSQLMKKKYYKINTYKAIKDEKQALNDIEELLINSVEKRLESDVEIASLLSGGIDSSFISALYTKISGKKINTFSVGYNEHKNYCELKYAKITADHIGSTHTPLEINHKEYINHFEETLHMLEEPHGDSAAIPLNILSKHINQAGFKTLLSGEGSDEIFLGYETYGKFLKYYDFEKTLSDDQNFFLNDIIGALQNNTKESEYLRRIVKKQNLYNSFGEIYTDIQKKKLFKKVPTFKNENAKQDPVDWMSYIDLKIWLGEALLSKVDRITSGNSLEVRTPFLDFNLVNYMFSVESNIKVGDTNKYLLKKIASKYIPSEIINRSKKGFNSPFNEWLFKEYKDKILDVIIEVNNATNLFNNEYILHIYELAKLNKFKQHLYTLFVFSLWYKKEFLS